MISGGFLILGHDVDKYDSNTRLPTFERFGFEKMQSFSGEISQLNFWGEWIAPSKVVEYSQCKGEVAVSLFLKKAVS